MTCPGRVFSMAQVTIEVTVQVTINFFVQTTTIKHFTIKSSISGDDPPPKLFSRRISYPSRNNRI